MVRVTVLGSGDAFGSGGRLHSAYMVESAGVTFLIDCGPTVLQSLKSGQHDTGRIDFVLVSHLHGDHFGGIPFLFMEYIYERPRRRPLGVYGPLGTERRVHALFAALYEKNAQMPTPFPVRFEQLEPGTTRDIGDVRVSAFCVPHTPELVALGYRIEIDGRSILYSGDSAWTEDFIARSRGADLFICECSTYETRLDIHVAYPEIAARARDLGCKRLLLSHLGAEPLRHLSDITLECARDGMIVEL